MKPHRMPLRPTNSPKLPPIATILPGRGTGSMKRHVGERDATVLVQRLLKRCLEGFVVGDEPLNGELWGLPHRHDLTHVHH